MFRSQYFALAANGKSAVNLEAPGESGIRARMRSSYINGSSGDSVNSTTQAPGSTSPTDPGPDRRTGTAAPVRPRAHGAVPVASSCGGT